LCVVIISPPPQKKNSFIVATKLLAVLTENSLATTVSIKFSKPVKKLSPKLGNTPLF
jgi:hypothetical protein